MVLPDESSGDLANVVLSFWDIRRCDSVFVTKFGGTRFGLVGFGTCTRRGSHAIWMPFFFFFFEVHTSMEPKPM